MIAAVILIVMSSADSFLNWAAIAFINAAPRSLRSKAEAKQKREKDPFRFEASNLARFGVHSRRAEVLLITLRGESRAEEINSQGSQTHTSRPGTHIDVLVPDRNAR